MTRHATDPAAQAGRRSRHVGARLLLALALAAVAMGSLAASVAADDLTMKVTVQLQGHIRLNSWMAIAVDLTNAGPALTGELRVDGQAGQTRYSVPVDMPTQSSKRYVIYARPSAGFNPANTVQLVADGRVVSQQTYTVNTHDASQLVVGIVAEQPQQIAGALHFPPAANAFQTVAPAVISLRPEDLPERVQGWGAVDRLIWQDVDAARLTTDQKTALAAWIASGGRLLIVGGTGGPGSLGGFPDELLPYRPAATIDIAPEAVRHLVGQAPTGATDVPALAGDLTAGRALAKSGDRVIAAERSVGSGVVDILGFDPSTGWLAGVSSGLLQRLVPAKAATTIPGEGDDTQLQSAVQVLPALALPPIAGLLVILAGYIVVLGPVNYLVLRRFDRRELAWITMPVIVVVFTVGAYGFGSALRGSEVIVNEVAIVQGSPGAETGMARVILGVFSPTRGSYQATFPGGALLSSPNQDIFGGSAGIDVVQGEPARVRDLSIGFGSLRTVRAEMPVAVPKVDADLRLAGNRITGTITNRSTQTILKPAVVLGSSVVTLADLPAGSSTTLALPLGGQNVGRSLSDQVVGSAFFEKDPSAISSGDQASAIRRAMIDQLTIDPFTGMSNILATDRPVLLGWGEGNVLGVTVDGQQPRRSGTILYYLPLRMAIGGPVTFGRDSIASSVVASDALTFSKDPSSLVIGQGSMTVAFRPISFDGELLATGLRLTLNGGGDSIVPPVVRPIDPIAPCPKDGPCVPVKPADCANPPCKDVGQPNANPSMPTAVILDIVTGTWQRLPDMTAGTTTSINRPERYVDPATGTVLVRFENGQPGELYFTPILGIDGTVR